MWKILRRPTTKGLRQIRPCIIHFSTLNTGPYFINIFSDKINIVNKLGPKRSSNEDIFNKFFRAIFCDHNNGWNF